MSGQLDRDAAAPMLQVQFDGLRESREVVDAKHSVAIIGRFAHESQHRRVGTAQFLERPDGECIVSTTHRKHHPGEVEQRRRSIALRLDVDRLIAINRVLAGRQVEAAWVCGGESGVAVRCPLHRGAHAVAIPQPDHVAHADLVAVIQDRGAGQRQ